MGALIDNAAEYFRQQKWTIEAASDRPVLRLPFEHQGEVWMCYAEAREEQNRVIFYTVLPVNVPDAQRRTMAELITRANYGLAVGNFELDFGDGELRCKTSIDVSGDRLSHALLHQLVVINLRLVRHYLPAVRGVLAGATPFDAITRAGG